MLFAGRALRMIDEKTKGPTGYISCIMCRLNWLIGKGDHFGFPPKNHKLGWRRWYQVSCQVSLNSIQGLLKRRKQCLWQSEAGEAILVFSSALKRKRKIPEPVLLHQPLHVQKNPKSNVTKQKIATKNLDYTTITNRLRTRWRTLRCCFLSKFV